MAEYLVSGELDESLPWEGVDFSGLSSSTAVSGAEFHVLKVELAVWGAACWRLMMWKPISQQVSEEA